MHILDFVMYLVTAGVIWGLLDIVGKGEYTQELGGLIGLFIIFLYTIAYIIVFCFWPDWNWTDIFHGVYNAQFSKWFNEWFKL